MTVSTPYVTRYRRYRDRTYVVTMRWAIAAAVVLHVALVPAFAPLTQQIPLVRHIGYEGALRLFPEISVKREPGEYEAEEQQARGVGSKRHFELIDARLVTEQASVEEVVETETGDYEEDYGEELLHYLERSLPQPTSRDVVLVKFVKPVYPPLSIAAGREGVVRFRLHVSSRGRVIRAWLLSSEVDAAMEIAAKRAILQWRFEPHAVEGVAVDFLVDQRVRFRLNDVLTQAGEAPHPESVREESSETRLQ
jgi:TonB family protein